MSRYMNPYEVLNLDPNSSIEEVNRAYYYIAKIYHPNKGGNEQEFLRFQRAYKQIIEARGNGDFGNVAPKDFTQLRDQSNIEVDHRYQPRDFAHPSGNGFNRKLFNQRFQNAADSYTYNIDEIDDPDQCRDQEAYKREYARVTAEAEGMVPFGNGRFNNTTFNQAFVHLKEQSMKQQNSGIPDPMQSREIMACTNLNDPKNPGTGEYTGFDQAYDTHKNPDRYDRTFLSQFQGQPDITKISALSNTEMRRRIANRQTMKLDYNRERLVTDLNVQLQEVDGIESKKAAEQLEKQRRALAQTQAAAQVHSLPKRGVDMFDRMSALRAPAVQLQQPFQYHEQEMRHYQPIDPVLFPGTPPPLQKKKKSSRSAEQSIEDELREMRKHLKQQKKLIRQLQQKQ